LITQGYRAELLIRRTAFARPITIRVNGGCNLLQRVGGAADYIAEQIHMPLPIPSTITVTWIPGEHHNGTPFIRAFAGYEEPNRDYIRWDNAHNRDTLHLDVNYRGRTSSHDERIDLRRFQWTDRRRIAIVQLLQTLELNLDWRIPVWFYMPWSFWWDEYSDLPYHVRERTPPSVSIARMCEAIMYYASFSPDTSRAFQVGAAGNWRTMDAIMESMDRVASAIARGETLSWNVSVLGYLLIVPFPIYAPLGSQFEGPSQTVQRLVRH